ncbi:hypothetical protein [Paratractidigestivibacter sp.]|uniref:hypothetical protein n=1 Tax=Paratractidigestivibacter sp. TaxID=2847316 RepID=UPI002AC8EAD3|nr:hypothetical protein [Paratractidigestivibacter sp.]
MKYPPCITYVGGKPFSVPEGMGEGAPRREVLVTIDTKPYASKPPKESGEVARVSNRLMSIGPAVATAEELARSISEGRAFLPSVNVGKRSPDTWTAQQLFCIDVDNDAETLRRCGHTLPYFKGINRAFALGLPLIVSYLSFSATDMSDRYRLLFDMGEPTEDKARAEEFGAALLAAYPEADQSSTQLNRLFYGTDKEVQLWAPRP